MPFYEVVSCYPCKKNTRNYFFILLFVISTIRWTKFLRAKMFIKAIILLFNMFQYLASKNYSRSSVFQIHQNFFANIIQINNPFPPRPHDICMFKSMINFSSFSHVVRRGKASRLGVSKLLSFLFKKIVDKFIAMYCTKKN